MEHELLKTFLHYVVANKNYSRDAIQLDMPIGNKYRADMVLVDTTNNEPLAVFEFLKNPESINHEVVGRLAQYVKLAGNEDMPSYLVTKGGNYGFLVYKCKGDSVEEIQPDELPELGYFKNRNAVNLNAKTRIETKKTVDQFKVICSVAAVFVGFILICDIFEVFMFSG